MSAPSPRTVLAIGVLMWVAGALFSFAHGTLLGHDEAQYALAARDFLAGAPPRWNYLSIGMVLTSTPAMLVGANEWTLRIVPVLFGVGLIFAAHRVARLVVDELSAACLPAVLAVTVCFARRSAENLSDIPATACLLMAIAVLLEELARDGGPSWRLVKAALWGAAAFYLRYGSLLPLAVIGAVAALGGFSALARRPLPSVALVLVGGLLLVPHLLLSHQWTGHVLGVLRESSTTIPAESGLRTYVTSNPFTYYGTLATPLLVAGLLSVLRRHDRRSIMVWAIAVADIIVVGWTTEAQSRYIFLGLALLLMLGVREAIDLLRARRTRWLAIATAIALGLAWLVVLIGLHSVDKTRSKALAHVLEASALIRRDNTDGPCYAMCRRTTSLEWYGGCTVVTWVTEEMRRERTLYVVSQPGKPEQPQLERIPGHGEVLLDRPGELVITRFRKLAPPSPP